MQSRDFVYWLQGYFEITDATSNRAPDGLSTGQVEMIKVLEAAEGPDRSIDGMIAHAVNLHLPDDPQGWPLRYTESIDAAMTLVPEGMEKDFTDLYGVARVSVGINAEPGPFYGTHEGGSLAIALCIAALKARSLPAI